jgi:negative regulator of sigma-B (phosphoserine phosphatase)
MTVAPNHSMRPWIVTWGVAGRALAGELESGDAYTAVSFAHGALVAVIDGLGHGSEAAAAAKMAVATLERFAGKPAMDLMQRCHEALRGSRGAVLSMATFCARYSTMTWLGVGNVEGVLFRAGSSGKQASESLLVRSGVVGYQMPPLRAATLPVRAGDTLLLATDGIRGDFSDASPLDRDPQAVADEVLLRYGKATDDALVLVARCSEGSS